MTPTLFLVPFQPDRPAWANWPAYTHPADFVAWAKFAIIALEMPPESEKEKRDHPIDQITARFIRNLAEAVQ